MKAPNGLIRIGMLEHRQSDVWSVNKKNILNKIVVNCCTGISSLIYVNYIDENKLQYTNERPFYIVCMRKMEIGSEFYFQQNPITPSFDENNMGFNRQLSH